MAASVTGPDQASAAVAVTPGRPNSPSRSRRRFHHRRTADLPAKFAGVFAGFPLEQAADHRPGQRAREDADDGAHRKVMPPAVDVIR